MTRFFSMIFQAPEVYLRNKIRSYGGEIRYTILYEGYNVQSMYIDAIFTNQFLLFYSLSIQLFVTVFV